MWRSLSYQWLTEVQTDELFSLLKVLQIWGLLTRMWLRGILLGYLNFLLMKFASSDDLLSDFWVRYNYIWLVGFLCDWSNGSCGLVPPFGIAPPCYAFLY